MGREQNEPFVFRFEAIIQSKKESHYNTHCIIFLAYNPNLVTDILISLDNSNVQTGDRGQCCKAGKGRSESGWSYDSRSFLLRAPVIIVEVNSDIP